MKPGCFSRRLVRFFFFLPRRGVKLLTHEAKQVDGSANAKQAPQTPLAENAAPAPQPTATADEVADN